MVENIANKLDVSKRTIERDLSTLQKANIIRHSESRSKGFWELTIITNQDHTNATIPFHTPPYGF